MKKLISLILLWGTAALAQAAPLMSNAFKVCDEGGTITASSASSPVAIQFGKGSTWNAPVTVGGEVIPLYVFYTNPVLGGDPAPGVLKELDVQEKAESYTVTCNHPDGTASIVTVPALIPPPPPPALPAPAPTLTIKLDTAGVQFSTCMDKTAVDSNGDEYFVLICRNVPK